MLTKNLDLNDKELRLALIIKLKKQRHPPKKIIEELPVNNGNAIADVVTIHSETHCYELKGDNDKVERVIAQGASYNLAFRKITLVTTSKHIVKAFKLCPPYWGIIEAKHIQNNIALVYKRKAIINPLFDKNIALKTLWKSEMLNIANSEKIELKAKQKTRDIISLLLSNKLNKEELNIKISSQLKEREKSNI